MHANSRELTVPGVCPNHRPPAVGRRLLAVKMPFAASGFQTFRALRVLRGSLLVLLCFAGCAGYQIGNQSLFPQEVHSIYVPVFKSNSFRRNLGERLTEAVIKEIQKRTTYTLTDEAHADTILSGAIIQETKTVLIPDLSGDAREVQTAINVQVSWTDRHGIKMREDKNIPLPPEIADVSGTGNLVPEVGQSVATAQQQAICRVAQQIVGLMEKPW